ncbi:Reticulon-3 [Merluccius polli]|uniref:Reticulon n=1 Tax=Merluccius polli TaxID=89951 RepID=A0AA47NAA4_MERPO|nr:Reticulon-3 [Merluccius polli]
MDTAKHIDSIPQEKTDSKIHMDTDEGPHTPDTTSDPESIETDCSVSRATDSFVDFMKECLKSRQDPEPKDALKDVAAKDEQPGNKEHALQSPPTMVMDLEQEELTICALKELGSSQEEEEDVLTKKTAFKPQSEIIDREKMGPGSGGVHQSPCIPTSPPPSTQASPTSDCTYSKEVEAIEEWVAEAYYLAEHVLTAILTHLSGTRAKHAGRDLDPCSAGQGNPYICRQAVRRKQIKDLIHWRDPKKSGVVFGVSLLVLLSLAAFSVISVVSYLLLALLCVTITFRIYKSVVQAVQKSSDGHPFKALMDKDVSIPPETFRKHVDASLTYINRALKQMSRLFLVEDLVDSLKLAVGMWLLTYVGAVFNGITILILADILLFAVPPIYEKNKTQIDQYIDVVRTQINSTMAK